MQCNGEGKLLNLSSLDIWVRNFVVTSFAKKYLGIDLKQKLCCFIRSESRSVAAVVSCYCFAAAVTVLCLGDIVSVVCSIVLSKGCKLFM